MIIAKEKYHTQDIKQAKGKLEPKPFHQWNQIHIHGPLFTVNLYSHNIKYINCDYTCRKKIFEKNYCDIETFPSIVILLNYKIIHYYVLLLEVGFHGIGDLWIHHSIRFAYTYSCVGSFCLYFWLCTLEQQNKFMATALVPCASSLGSF